MAKTPPLEDRVAEVLDAHRRVGEAAQLRTFGDEQRQAWEAAARQFRRALVQLYGEELDLNADRVKLGHGKAVEEAIAFLELDPMCFRSGYVKADLLRALRRVELTEPQKERLRSVIVDAARRGARREFRWYCRLARSLDTPALRDELWQVLDSGDPRAARAAGWALTACMRNDERPNPEGSAQEPHAGPGQPTA